jgi:glyoxylase-like metal-dependent hydrolase (beta-lactamase superfamily II)
MFASWSEQRLPPMTKVSPNTWVVPMKMPGEHLTYSLAYLIVDGEEQLHVIDPGWNSEENFEALVNAIREIDGNLGDLATVTVTHSHPDHAGLVERLNRESEADLLISLREQTAFSMLLASRPSAERRQRQLDEWGVPLSRRPDLEPFHQPRQRPSAPMPDRLLDDGDLLPIPGREIRAAITPGHTSGHLCLVDSGQDLLFTGDHVLPTIYPGLGLGGSTISNPIGDYLTSLDRMAPYDEFVICPGHEFPFWGLATRRKELARHHIRRSLEVRQLLQLTPELTIWQIAARLTWTAGWENLRGFYVESALSQTANHVAYVRELDGK